MREEDAGEREAGAYSTTPTYTVRRDGPAREPSLSAYLIPVRVQSETQITSGSVQLRDDIAHELLAGMCVCGKVTTGK